MPRRSLLATILIFAAFASFPRPAQSRSFDQCFPNIPGVRDCIRKTLCHTMCYLAAWEKMRSSGGAVTGEPSPPVAKRMVVGSQTKRAILCAIRSRAAVFCPTTARMVSSLAIPVSARANRWRFALDERHAQRLLVHHAFVEPPVIAEKEALI